MGQKESKVLPGTGIVGDIIPQNATLINETNARRGFQTGYASRTNTKNNNQAQPPDASKALGKSLPVVIRYKGPDTKQRLQEGQTLTAVTNGKTFPMVASDGNYFSVLELPPGENAVQFRDSNQGSDVFVDSNQPVAVRELEGKVNIVNVAETLLHTKDDDDAFDDASGWGQEHTTFEESRKYPPILPPHLRYSPLNAPPTPVRCGPDGSITPATLAGEQPLDAEHLPLPLSVTINHVYFQRREDHTVTGITTRFRDKYSTVAYYRGTKKPSNAAAPAS